eukprot:4014711-Pleurochrysis_carterae.AAC.2
MVDASTQSGPLDALIDALIGAVEFARSSGQAATRVSDPHSGVEHHHTPLRASGSGALTVPGSLLARRGSTLPRNANP